jgi:hypothetical protein
MGDKEEGDEGDDELCDDKGGMGIVVVEDVYWAIMRKEEAVE